MRIPKTMLFTVLMLALAACGGTKATPTAVAPIASAGTLPLFATLVPTGVATASTPDQTAVARTAPVSPSPATPTPLAGAPTATPARASVAVTQPPPTAAASRAPQATATPQPAKAARVAEIPSSAPQQTIGAQSDGLTLLNVRTGKNEGFTRLVFDVSKQDGSAAPVPRTRLWMQGTTVVIAFGGVRDDVYAQSLGGGEQPINVGMVQTMYRIPVRDDATVAYGINVTGGTKVTLSSTTLPTRVIVDVADK